MSWGEFLSDAVPRLSDVLNVSSCTTNECTIADYRHCLTGVAGAGII
ncbi:MAG: hypothetical protein KTM48_03655 [Wolbachia endosymbiont of Pissodes strobi]|nr:hypothetical protein [Wolbachia endosymbiont of Pissodes strobi]